MSDFGKLVPQGGGDEVPLLQETITIGRRESCDVCLPFANVSGKHCELVYTRGCWVVNDLGSKNGIKVNDEWVHNRVLNPGDVLSIAKHDFVIDYSMTASRETLDELTGAEVDMKTPLLEKAGLLPPEKPRSRPKASRVDLAEMGGIDFGIGDDGPVDER